MFKYSILSFNFGNYDKFREPEEIDPECEYIYVTDNKDYKSSIWNVKILSNFLDKSPLFKSFYVRYHPEEFVSTDKVIIIDASMQIHKSLKPIMASFQESRSPIGLSLYYKKITSFNKLNEWYKDNKFKNNNRHISPSSYFKAARFLFSNISTKYYGYAEAGFQIRNLSSPFIKEFQKITWKKLLELGFKGDPFRLDEIVISTFLQTRFKRIKPFFMCRQVIQSKFIDHISHLSGKFIKEKISYNQIYFYNKPQKVHIFE